jgi:hypothetical protein
MLIWAQHCHVWFELNIKHMNLKFISYVRDWRTRANLCPSLIHITQLQ